MSVGVRYRINHDSTCIDPLLNILAHVFVFDVVVILLYLQNDTVASSLHRPPFRPHERETNERCFCGDL